MTVLAALLAVAVFASSVPATAAWRYKKKKSSSAKFKSSSKSKRYASHRSKRRHRVACNTGAGRQQAYAFLQSSRDLAMLASLEYKVDPNVQQYIDNDRGELADDEVDEAETAEITDVDDARFTADASTLRKLWFTYIRNVDPAEKAASNEDNFIAGSIDRKELMTNIINWVGSPYYYGGAQRSGVDCSAFVRAIYHASADIQLPRTAAMQSTVGEHVRNMDDLKFGDLIFFNTRSRVYVSHVGIYLGDNLFAHASSRYGVTVSSLQTDYYKGRFLGGKRLRPEDVQVLASSNRNFSSLRTKSGSAMADE
jgi:cell wall-associated NlpC family hydrolase